MLSILFQLIATLCSYLSSAYVCWSIIMSFLLVPNFFPVAPGFAKFLYTLGALFISEYVGTKVMALFVVRFMDDSPETKKSTTKE